MLSFLMNEIFGIDPNSPSDVKDLKYMLDLFGLSNGRFIAAYPYDWEILLRSKFNQLGDIDKARVNRLLEIHKDVTLRVDGGYRRSKDWIDNAVELQQMEKKFSKLFSIEGNPYKVPPLQALLWNDDELLSDGRGAHIPMTVESYCDAARPLFAFSSEVHLIDPYFTLRRENGDRDYRRWKVLSGFFSEAKKSERCDSFCFHLSDQKFFSQNLIDKFVEDIELIRQEVNFKDLNLSYIVEDEKIHGRYLFSVKGGLQFDHGFDTDFRKKNHVHWLSSKELEPLLNTF
jgi:hypothetical protein